MPLSQLSKHLTDGFARIASVDVVQRFVDWLRSGVSEGFHIRQEQPLTFADSEPEPDVSVVFGSPDDYGQSHPASAELVIEVTGANDAPEITSDGGGATAALSVKENQTAVTTVTANGKAS